METRHTSSKNLEGNNAKRKRQPKKQWSSVADATSKKQQRKKVTKSSKITTDVLKKTRLHAKDVFTSDSDSSDEMTFNKNDEKMHFTDKNKDLCTLRSVRGEGNESPTKEELKAMLQEVLEKNKNLQRNSKGQSVQLPSTSHVAKSSSLQDTTLENPLLNNAMSTTEEVQNRPDGSYSLQERNSYKHESNNKGQKHDYNKEVYDNETSEDEDEQSHEQDKENNDTTDNKHNDVDGQLFGKYWEKDKMMLIKDGVYCKRRILESAKGVSFKASNLVRRLLEGVFKPEALLQSTVSGRAPRAQGKERQSQHVDPLNVTARNAIIDYALEEAHKKHWTIQSVSQLQQTISQRIGEIKRENRKNAQL